MNTQTLLTTTIGDSSYTHYGSDWATSFLSSGQNWQTYTTQKGWQVTPKKGDSS